MMQLTIPLFEGLDEAALNDIHGHMQPRRFGAHAIICREGEPGNSLFLIQSGLAQVLVGGRDGPRAIARLRRGEVVGEMSLLTGEPRSATVMANVPTEVLELGREAFTALLAKYPALLLNLNRILSQRLARRNLQPVETRRGEVVALVAGASGLPLAGRIITATRAASPRSVIALDLTETVANPETALATGSVEGALSQVDDLLAAHGRVVTIAGSQQKDLPLLLEHMDRVVVLATAAEIQPLSNLFDPVAERLDVVLLRTEAGPAPPTVSGFPVARAIKTDPPGTDIAWIGRHLSRTKLGLALGAGGAKGYAHVATLHALESAGYTVDCVAGSSIGAMVGSWIGLGRRAAEVEQTMRDAFHPEKVAAMFKLSMAGLSSGLDVHTRICRETTNDCTFADLTIPLIAMAVDLNTREPAPIREGPVWEGLLASTALAGMFPPFQRGQQRLVDGLALIPVPSDAARDLGADVVVSVNLMSREMLRAWPGELPPPPPPQRKGSRLLETLLEVMDLAQLDASVRHAARADVVITPRFGPASWKDFHLADLFLAAGRLAAEEQLENVCALARPQFAYTKVY
jgi:predicted acylesterase/phospholipase RssA/CRP-like cAMP-binding protein